MDNNFLQRLLKLPSYELCGSKLYKSWMNNAKFGRDRQWLSYLAIAAPLMFIMLMVYVAKGFAVVIGLILFMLLQFLLFYDLDAFLCYFNKNSEYYRATGITKEDISKDKGLRGEFNAYVLSKKIGVPHKTLYNVCVPMPNGSFQEVDAIIITQHEIYVLECKNRTGYFDIDFNKTYWTQYIGNQEHKVPNIYLQNQEHIIAIDYYLKSKGIITKNFVYLNFLLTGGDFYFDNVEAPDEFTIGDLFYLARAIEHQEQGNKKNQGENFMENVYMALLPYALNGKIAKENMIHAREMEAKNGKIARGTYRYYRFEGGVPVAAGGLGGLLVEEEALLRKDNVYTQIGISAGPYYYWFAMPNIIYKEQ